MPGMSLVEAWNNDAPIHVWVTASIVKAYDESDDPDVAYGWIDPKFSMWETFDSRNDVSPALSVRRRDYIGLFNNECEAYEGMLADIRSVFDGYFLRVIPGASSFYSPAESVNPHTGDTATYALHMTTKAYVDDEWTMFEVIL